MRCLERLQRHLRQKGVPFHVRHHPIAFTAQEVAASEHLPGRLLAKTVMVIADGELAMLVIPAPYRVDMEKARAALWAAEVRLAREDEFAATFADCEVGAMPPFGTLYGVPVYVDKALAKDPTIVFRAGTHTDTISMSFADFERLVRPTVTELAHPEFAEKIG